MRKTSGILQRILAIEFGLLLAALLVVAGVWAFAELADEVVEGETHAFDEWVILALRTKHDVSDPLGPRWLEEFGRDLTALGGVGILSLITISVAGFLLLHRKQRTAAFVVAAVLGGLLLSSSLKLGFDRPRPDLVPHGARVYTASFPSGHSTMSAVAYLTLGGLLARMQTRRRDKIYVIAWALLITVAVGISRVYLGVHWPTDVLGGWTLGASWALLCWLAARWLQQRGAVEEQEEEEA